MAALVSLDQAKIWLRIPAEDSTHDTIVQMALEGAEAMLATLLGRSTLGRREITERLSGGGSPVIELSHWPVVDIESVSVARSYDEGLPLSRIRRWSDLSVGATPSLDDIYADERGRLWRRDGRDWPEGAANVEITYTAGYTPETLPADLRLLILQTASLTVRTRGKEGIRSESLSEYSITWSTPTPDEVLTIPGAAAVIRAHRRVSI